ncbi:MAG: hypothetical protein IJP79_07470 [Paludibacteraceae bacterium]|nr:hypothetical protein [Paludibacteraceae bacterium]MBQ6963524.1 hypothetical protein [Paludibacteraceae bacterium]MBQ7662462.1 hypothetical protein [Prevotella sp.]MBQ7748315.1 hypothetical protein [Paludibacteraceae bacterium]
MIDKLYVQALIDGLMIDKGYYPNSYHIEDRGGNKVAKDEYWFVLKVNSGVSINIDVLNRIKKVYETIHPDYTVHINIIDGLIDFFIDKQ